MDKLPPWLGSCAQQLLSVLIVTLIVSLIVALPASLTWYSWAAFNSGGRKEDALALLALVLSQPVLGTGAVAWLALAFKDPITDLMKRVGRPG
jgi:hypothetical protein